MTSQRGKQMQKTRGHRRSVCVFVFQSALQSSPWGLMQALEQQVGELRIDTDEGCCDGAQGDTGDSRPSSGTSTVLNLFCDLSSHVYVVKSSQVGVFLSSFQPYTVSTAHGKTELRSSRTTLLHIRQDYIKGTCALRSKHK